jgi:hypothetical protein
MREPKVYQFSTFVGTLCVTRDTNIHRLAVTLGVDAAELLAMINGQVIPSRAVVAQLAKVLESDPRYLEKLVEEIHKDLG